MFTYSLDEKVIITLSGKAGTVKARAEYVRNPNQYYIYHIDGMGDAVYNWYDECDLRATE